VLDIPKEKGCDEKAGYDEKYVDPDEAAM